VWGADLKEYEDGGGLRDDFRDVGVPPRWDSPIRNPEISDSNELSLASLLNKCRGKVGLCTGADFGGGIMESDDVGGCEPEDGVIRRLDTFRRSPEKVETIDALELTEAGREECNEGEGICEATITP
jgi:hypothetical protein